MCSQESRVFVALVQVSALIRRLGVSRMLVRALCVILVAANHRRSFHRARLSRNLTDLTLYEPPLLASLGELPIEPLEALLLCVQLAREGVEEFFRRHAKSLSQLSEGAKVRTPYLAGLDTGDRGGTHASLPSQPRLGPHPRATCALHSPAYLGHAHTSSLSTTKSLL